MTKSELKELRKKQAADMRATRTKKLCWKMIRGPKWEYGDNVYLAEELRITANGIRHYFTGKTLASEEMRDRIMLAAKKCRIDVTYKKVKK